MDPRQGGVILGEGGDLEQLIEAGDGRVEAGLVRAAEEPEVPAEGEDDVDDLEGGVSVEFDFEIDDGEGDHVEEGDGEIPDVFFDGEPDAGGAGDGAEGF